jgi:hypothetical protein
MNTKNFISYDGLYELTNMIITLDTVHRLRFFKHKCFGNWVCFCHQATVEDGSTPLNPLKRASLDPR